MKYIIDRTSIAVLLVLHRHRFGRTERAASVIEYALLVSLIALVCIGAVTYLGSKPPPPLSNAGDALGG